MLLHYHITVTALAAACKSVWWPNKLSRQIYDVTGTQLSAEASKASPASLQTKSGAHMRWADLGDHNGSNALIHRDKKKNSRLTGIQPSQNKRLSWLAEVVVLRSACLKSSGESDMDLAISCWCARALHYIIHMLHNTLAAWHTHTHTHTLTRLTHADTHAWGEIGSTTDVPFANVSAPSVSQAPPVY